MRVDNDFGLIKGTNLANHTASLAGRGDFVLVTHAPRGVTFRTKQSAYRFVAHLLFLAESLPDEDGAHDLASIQNAVESSLAE